MKKPPSDPIDQPASRFTYDLNGFGLFGIALYGAIQFLRPRTWARATIAAIGTIGFFASVLAYLGVGYGFGQAKNLNVLWLWMLCIGLVVIATLSGSDFQVGFSTAKATEERQKQKIASSSRRHRKMLLKPTFNA